MGSRFQWGEAVPPESVGMAPAQLESARRGLAERGTAALLVVRHDRIAEEWYAPGRGPTDGHYTASLAKALVGGMSLLVALADGRISVDDPACLYLSRWQDHPEKSRITVRHLATHSSGIEDAADDDTPHEELPGWKGAFWRREPDPFTVGIDEAPVLFPPGTGYHYSNPGMAALAYVVTASLKGSPQRDILSLLRHHVMEPIGVTESEWNIGYGQAYRVDGLDLYANWGGGHYTPRAVARVGRLMVRNGNWEGRQIVPREWVTRMLSYAGMPIPDRPRENPQPASGLCWWLNCDGVWPSIPRDAFCGAGAGNQILLVIPSLDLIVVRNGALLGDLSQGEGFWGGCAKYLFDPVVEAIMEG